MRVRYKLVAESRSGGLGGEGHAVEAHAMAMLSREEVIRLASTKAESEGIDLDEYQAPEARPLLSNPRDASGFRWAVIFRGREPVFGNELIVTVNNATKETEIILGRRSASSADKIDPARGIAILGF